MDAKCQDGAFIGIRDRSDEMLIMTPSGGVYKTRNVRRRPESERWDFEFLTTLKGLSVEPESGGGRDGSRCTSRGYGSPDASTRTSPQVVVPAAPVDRAASRLCIRRSDVQKYGYSMNCPGSTSVMTGTTARAHTEECRRRLESCLAEIEETKFRSEAAKLRVEGWLASRVESTEKS